MGLMVKSKTSKYKPQPVRLPSICSLFNRAICDPYSPQLEFDIDGFPIIMGIASDRSKYPGAIRVTSYNEKGEFVWLGWIVGHNWIPGYNISKWITEWLKKFNNDPEGVLSSVGQKVGRCVMCAKPLSTKSVRNRGYDLRCAEKWNLPD